VIAVYFDIGVISRLFRLYKSNHQITFGDVLGAVFIYVEMVFYEGQ